MDYFTISNFLPMLIWCGSCLSAIKVRKEIIQKTGTDETNEEAVLQEVRAKAFPGYLYHMVQTFGGGALANLALGLSPLEPFLIQAHFLSATFAWMMVFYCPGDFMYKFYVNNNYVYMYLQITNEMWRALKIYSGVELANESRILSDDIPRVFFYALIGTIKGNGGEILHMIRQFTLGQQLPALPSVMKISFVTAFLFSLPYLIPGVNHETMFYLVMTAFLGLKIASVIVNSEFDTVAKFSFMGALVFAAITSTFQALKTLATTYLG